MDDLAPAIPFHFQFVYKNEKQDPNFMNPELLKQSLSKLISEYPIIAGKARIEARKWYIDTCESDTVPFIVATSELALSDFDCTDYDTLPKNLHTQWMKPEDPIFAVQVTYFQCGGVILAPEMLHQLGDGESLSQLMHKWVAIHNNLTYTKPLLVRTIPISTNPPPLLFPNWHQSPVATDYELYAKLPLCTAKMIEFTPQELSNMKQDATSSNWISSNDALCSHMWKIITRARGLPPTTGTCLLHSCNIRSRLVPTISKDYIGYMITSAQTKRISVQDLLSSSIADIAQHSRQAINETCSQEKVQSFIDWIHVTPGVSPSDIHVLFKSDVFATSWVTFGLYNVKFENEAPLFAGEIPSILDGVFKLVERKNGGIIVQLSLLREHMDKLLVDPELHKYQ
jgi:shikimate O-hydroxycinnamoyltransferase